MRPVTAVLIAVTLLGAGGAAFTAKKFIERRAAQAVEMQEKAKRDVPVLVAARAIEQGTLLKEEDLRWDPWPVFTAEAAKVVVRLPDKKILDHLPGKGLARTVMAGEPIRPEMVFDAGKGSLMPGVLSPGMRAVGITVSAASAASGFVLPGDRVDVILILDTSKGGAPMPGGGRYVAETVLQNVRVLAVDQILASAQAPKPKGKKAAAKPKKGEDVAEDKGPATIAMVGKTIAVEVSSEQAEQVLIAAKVGSLALALRSLAQGTEDEPRGVPYATDLTTSKALQAAHGGAPRVIRGGQ
jgi:pilus assembly protein CpaB